ncbi:hypothetical protein NF212_18635 [Parasalinivibrio latis]|uniref:hypothetical protein n=1 Tax=Parasalinivibrio latis TaxID=2952610 RepID=UPI0030E49676
MKHWIWMATLFVASFNANSAEKNDYPTLERVRFVFECMELHGGQTYENLYSCSCMIDQLALYLTIDEYVQYDAYERMRSMMGERGGYFRSSDASLDIRKEFRSAKLDAERQCFSDERIPKRKVPH